MLLRPLSQEFHAAINSYTSILMRNTSDPGCLVHVLWALAVYDRIDGLIFVLKLLISAVERIYWQHLRLVYCALNYSIP